MDSSSHFSPNVSFSGCEEAGFRGPIHPGPWTFWRCYTHARELLEGLNGDPRRVVLGWQAHSSNEPSRPNRPDSSSQPSRSNRPNRSSQPSGSDPSNIPKTWNACHKAAHRALKPVGPDGKEYDSDHPGECYYRVAWGDKGEISVKETT